MEQLRFPSAGDYCTQAWAAEQIGVSLRTVARLIKDGKLKAFRPLKGSKESGRRHTLMDTEQVRAYAVAHKMVKTDV
jgi:excisionase family DNA binding protein